MKKRGTLTGVGGAAGGLLPRGREQRVGKKMEGRKGGRERRRNKRNQRKTERREMARRE